MSITRPCIRGKMGSVTYYETTMTARELTSSVRPARDGDDWASASIDERIQREVNDARVKKTIVPYLAQHQDRFFGSFIVLVQEGQLAFEPLSDLVKDLPKAYQNSAEDMGFVTIDGGDRIALDGQHRLVAFREVITAGSDHGPLAPQVGDDEVCVLFIENESAQKTRRIFNKVNRHAKPTGRADNIVTSEDDGYAIITRRLLDREREAPLAARLVNGEEVELVNWSSSTMSKHSTRLTTLSAVYETVIDVLTDAGFTGFSERDNPIAPDDASLDAAYDVASRWWDDLLEIPALAQAVADPTGIPEVRFSNSNPATLLLRPVGQIALVRGLVLALQRSKGEVDRRTMIRRAAKLDWSASGSGMWRDSIVKPDGRMVARKEAYNLASRLLAYMLVPEYTTEEEKHQLWLDWNEARGKNPYGEVDEVADEELPEDLPSSVSDA